VINIFGYAKRHFVFFNSFKGYVALDTPRKGFDRGGKHGEEKLEDVKLFRYPVFPDKNNLAFPDRVSTGEVV